MAKSLTTIARPYAKAIFAHALEKDTCAQWEIFLNNVSQIIADKHIAHLLVHPFVSSEQLFELLLSILPKEGLETYQRDFLHLLAMERRLNLLPEITVLFKRLQSEAQNTLEAEVTSAFALTPDQIRRLETALKKRLNKEKIKIHCIVDSSLLGGAIIRARDFVIDGSGRGQLEKMRKYLS